MLKSIFLFVFAGTVFVFATPPDHCSWTMVYQDQFQSLHPEKWKIIASEDTVKNPQTGYFSVKNPITTSSFITRNSGYFEIIIDFDVPQPAFDVVLVDPDGRLELDVFSYNPQNSAESHVDLNYVDFQDQPQSHQFSFPLPEFNQGQHVFGVEIFEEYVNWFVDNGVQHFVNIEDFQLSDEYVIQIIPSSGENPLAVTDIKAYEQGSSVEPFIVGGVIESGYTMGQSASMEVEAYGSVMEFQWFKNGEPIEGADENYFETAPLSEENEGDAYFVVIENSIGYTESDTVKVDFSKPMQTSIGDRNHGFVNDPTTRFLISETGGVLHLFKGRGIDILGRE